MKDEVKIYNKLSILKEKCQSCDKISHSFTECPIIFIQKNYEHNCIKIAYTSKQHRKKFNRKINRTKNLRKMKKKFEKISVISDKEYTNMYFIK